MTRTTLLLTLTLLALTACESRTTSSPQTQGEMALPDDALFQQRSIGRFQLAGKKVLAMTFDDGPTPVVTPALLDVLKKYGIKATFFIWAEKIPGNESIMQRMKGEGHVIGNHSYSHQKLRAELYLKDKSALMHQIYDSHKLIKPYMDPTKGMYFRAPYGAWMPEHADFLNRVPELRRYVGPIYWNIGGEIRPAAPAPRPRTAEQIQASADWDCWTNKPEKDIFPIPPDICAVGYLREIDQDQGGVVLMHDIDINTVHLVEILLPRLIQQGYRFVTLDEVSSLDAFKTGAVEHAQIQ